MDLCTYLIIKYKEKFIIEITKKCKKKRKKIITEKRRYRIN